MKGELVYIKLYEVGRTVDLEKAQQLLSTTRVRFKLKSKKGTPSYVNLPSPLYFEVESLFPISQPYITTATLCCKIYLDGVISLIARLSFEATEIEKLHELALTHVSSKFGESTIEQWLDFHFEAIFELIKTTVEIGIYNLEERQTEDYSILCIHDEINDPYEFVQNNKNYFATLLMGEDFCTNLHESQIKDTLKNPFSFATKDLVIYDLDRTLIVDPNKDYDDILLIIELAVYQLLELRVLDEISNQKLEIVESDLKMIFRKNKTLRNIKKKLKDLLPFHYDLIFILENIENVSKIIGDYFLAKQYEHLCNIFELNKWIKSIRDRLDYLEQIFEIAKTEMNEKIMLLLEAGLAIIFILEFIFFFL